MAPAARGSQRGVRESRRGHNTACSQANMLQWPYTDALLCALQALFLATLCLFVSSLAFLIFPKVACRMHDCLVTSIGCSLCSWFNAYTMGAAFSASIGAGFRSAD